MILPGMPEPMPIPDTPFTRPKITNRRTGSRVPTTKYDQKVIQAGGSQYQNEEDDGINKDGEMYDTEEYLAEVGELNCYCLPSRVYGFKDFGFRTLAWLLLDKEQIFSAITMSITVNPEAISTTFIDGVPIVFALQATWIMNIITALIGGRP